MPAPAAAPGAAAPGLDEAILAIGTLALPPEDRREILELLAKVLSNILAHPDEAKYRRIREANRPIAAGLHLAAPGARAAVAALLARTHFACSADGTWTFDPHVSPSALAGTPGLLRAVAASLEDLTRERAGPDVAPPPPAAATPRAAAAPSSPDDLRTLRAEAARRFAAGEASGSSTRRWEEDDGPGKGSDNEEARPLRAEAQAGRPSLWSSLTSWFSPSNPRRGRGAPRGGRGRGQEAQRRSRTVTLRDIAPPRRG